MTNLSLRSAVQFLRADAYGEGEGLTTPRIPRFSMVGYSGGVIRQAWSREPIVIDLAGMSVPSVIPIVFGHDYSLESVLGQGTGTVASQLVIEGAILAQCEAATQVVQLGDRGYQWQASVGADVDEDYLVADGDTAQINGQTFTGPLRVVKRSTLRECSFVTLGADAATAVTITAKAGESPMSDETKAADAMPTGPVQSEEHGGPMPTGPSDVASAAPKFDIVAIRAEVVADVTREVKATLLKDLRDVRGGPAIHASKPALDEDQVTIAAMQVVGGLGKQVEARYGDSPMVEAAHMRSRSIGLQDVLITAARRGGYDGVHKVTAGNIGVILRAAFATHNISSILAATYNKYLLNGFEAVESVWDQISLVRPLNDLKAITGVRLDGGFVFDEVGGDGKLKSADAADATRTLQAKTYGRISSITRADIINDDLGALTAVPRRLGRGAALKFNSVFWTEFQVGSTVNASYYEGATAGAGNALAIGAVETAYGAYRSLTDPNGNPLGITPKILLVPVGLRITADKIQTGNTLLASSLGSTSGKVLEPQANVLAGKFNIVDSAYLTSSSTWWMCADPADLPTMEVGFLNGQRTPIVEQAEASFDTLGIEVRGYFDFGVSKAESRACYRMATA
jgi:phage major head subunit gpT-like protein